MRMVRDCDGELYMEIPGKPGWFASAADFQRGKKYVDQYSYEEREIAADGPFVVEWEVQEALVTEPHLHRASCDDSIGNLVCGYPPGLTILERRVDQGGGA